MASPYLYNISDVNLLLVVSRLRREQHEFYMPKNRYEQYQPAENFDNDFNTYIWLHKWLRLN